MSRTLLVLIMATVVSSCTTEVVSWEEPQDEGGQEEKTEGSRPRAPEDDDEQRDDPSHDDGDPSEVRGIPVGQMPPPGSCRIWYPDRSAGHQPPSASCDELRGHVPDDAWLLYRPTAEPRVYRIG
jgi:hypothetical protein